MSQDQTINQALFDAGWKRTSRPFHFVQIEADESGLRPVNIVDLPVWKTPKGNLFLSQADFDEGVKAQQRMDATYKKTSALEKILLEKAL